MRQHRFTTAVTAAAAVAATTAAVAAAVAATTAGAAAAPPDDQAVQVRNHADVSSVGEAANSGAVVPGAVVVTGDARSRVTPRQDAANRQRLVDCPRAACPQRAGLTNEAWLSSRASTGNLGATWPGGAIRTGDALSELSLNQAAVNRQVAAACGGCSQHTSLSNRLSAGSEADTANASDAPAGTRLATPSVASRLYLEQRSESYEIARGRCDCRQSAEVGNAASVWSRVGGSGAGGAGWLRTGASEPNRASITQGGRTNVIALQQSGQQVEQAGRYNLVRIHTRQTLVLKGAELVQRGMTTDVVTRSRAALPPGLKNPPAWRPGDVCLRREDGPAPQLSWDCAEGAVHGNAVDVGQSARANTAAVQQASQRVHQVGVYNVAIIILEQRIVLRPARDGAAVAPVDVRAARVWCSNARRSLAAVQQSSQSIRQSGRFNEARAVVIRRIKAPAAGPSRCRTA